jgi:hypothetical protein
MGDPCERWFGPLVVAAFGLSACMFEPGHEQVVQRRREVTFSGSVLTARAELIFEAGQSPLGPFTEIGSTLSSGVPMMLGGATLYAFSDDAAIAPSLWAQTCAGFETFVRARGGALVLTTYDSEAIAGETPAECVADEIAAGLPFVTAAFNCASPFGAPVRLRALGGGLSGTTIERDVRIVNPHQAMDYACVETIDGDLTIEDPTPSDIALPALVEVTGNVEVIYPRDGGGTARVVDLPALTTVGGDVDLSSPRPEVAEGETDIDFGLPVLASVGGDVTIEFELPGTGIDSLAGLPSLAAIAFDLEVVSLAEHDASYTNLLPNLAAVGGSAYLDLGLTSKGIFSALETVDGDFTLQIGVLVTGMESLIEVGGDFSFSILGSGGGFLNGGLIGGEMPLLATIGGDAEFTVINLQVTAGERYLETLSLVGGVLRFAQSEAPIESLGSLGVSVLGLDLDANPGLMDLAASLAHISVADDGPITITNNPAITDCDAQSYVDGLAGHTGPVVIAGNGDC